MMVLIKLMDAQDHDFLMDMHYESVHIVENKPSQEELLNQPHLKKYNEGWGRSGDRALIAWSGNQPVGAVWYRLFDETDPGYGFVDQETPEVGIALRPNFRQQGIGALLMKAILRQAGFDGFHSLSLSVDPLNQAAVRLYEKLGFVKCGTVGTSCTMKLINLKGYDDSDFDGDH